MNNATDNPYAKTIVVDDFSFAVETDCSADPLTGVGVWVWFRGEPCCDDNGHQHRFFLPLGVSDCTVADVCQAFTLATHCDSFAFAA